ncbi:GDSL-type esterase/lipase family protein [Clostridium sp. SHJSY1]|uniref:SGNH/GDSL hydrolase family protein n=1 Tax=Clostridium sp. SHJSY1 TaxID=2942483 RepID=UPI002876709B|nr:SGNH/GDSL hydrolase family protein [Clostridium sp. SHJSY1]MDS0528461.1 GDSL-type esterase/lipase family protein [Clostridium sp. SHJSY1]
MKKKITFLLAMSIALISVTPIAKASTTDNIKVNYSNSDINSNLNQLNINSDLQVNVDNQTVKNSVYKSLLIGRFDRSDVNAPRFAWSNSTIKARFIGTGISVNLKSSGDNWFNVVVDGVNQAPINVTPSTTSPIVLASGLKKDMHTIELVKRTEAYIGDAQFLGFQVSDGSLFIPPQSSSKRIMFIGDSITCGYGNEGTSQYQTFTTKNENSSLAYGAVTAKLLGADPMTISWSGKGVLRNYGGDTTDVMPDLMDQVLPYDKTLKWDSQSWIPQVVVINLSTNDYGIGIPDKADFTNAYTKLVDKVRADYPEANIYCAVGPMLSGDKLESARNYISGIATSKETSGDNKIHFIEFPVQDFANGLGEDWHPSVKTHELMANQLASQIQKDLGWNR